jgi:4-carboxymuconolactone decarboxylase
VSRLEPADVSTGSLKEVFDNIQESRGWVSNALRSLAHAPEGLKKFQAVGHYGRYDTELTEIQRELVILITGRNIPYAWGHHAPLARQAGLTEEQVVAIKASKVPPGLSARDAALSAYVLAFSTLGGVADNVFAELQKHFTPRQITDISLTSGYYLALGACLVAFQVELEPPEILQIELDWQRKQTSKA